jgi:phosphoribosylformimino-5-aminoimidazole carboxamide ribotide isomerase
MLVIPVIDIKDGQCFRIISGLEKQTHFYCGNPVTIAKLFRKENFKALHITDLDGAIHGEMRNYPIIKEITRSVDIPILLGGGIRDFESAKKMIEDLGVYRVVIGTAAMEKPDMIKKILDVYTHSKLAISIDEKLNNVVTKGWINYANITPLAFAKYMEELGVKRIIYQDVTRVGNLSGPNIERLLELAHNTGLKITSAGGIGNYLHLKQLVELNIPNIDSIIIGRALYENRFPCQVIWRDIEKSDTSLELPKVK